MDDSKRGLLRHTIATLAYRGGKTLRDAPEEFGGFRVSESSRTPAQILAHIGDLLDWALTMAKGKPEWRVAPPRSWEQDTERFFDGLTALDEHLAGGLPLETSPEKVFQGPIADALTHVGQLTMLRRIAGAPIKGENYSRAKIEAGRVGADQSAPKREFD